MGRLVRAVFYTHQTSDACSGACACDSKHQMEKTERYILTTLVMSSQQLSVLN